MFFASGLDGSTSLSSIHFTAFTGDTAYARDFQAQFTLDRSDHVDGFDIVFSKWSADLVHDRLLVW
jgi:hypothetical protein